MKIDATMPNLTAERIRKTAGSSPLLAMSAAYDTQAKEHDLKNESWIPMGIKLDGNAYTRQEAYDEANRRFPDHTGLQINRDGRTFKLRVPKEKEEESWRSFNRDLRPQPGCGVSKGSQPRFQWKRCKN